MIIAFSKVCLSKTPLWSSHGYPPESCFRCDFYTSLCKIIMLF